MSEEEKEAIETLKIIKNDETVKYYYTEKAINDIDVILTLISKQQKEIEEYNKRLTPVPDNYVPIEYQMINYVDKRNYISKDKIREKIEFYKSYGKIKNSNEYVMSEGIEILQELLGEENE